MSLMSWYTIYFFINVLEVILRLIPHRVVVHLRLFLCCEYVLLWIPFESFHRWKNSKPPPCHFVPLIMKYHPSAGSQAEGAASGDEALEWEKGVCVSKFIWTKMNCWVWFLRGFHPLFVGLLSISGRIRNGWIFVAESKVLGNTSCEDMRLLCRFYGAA